MPTISLFTTGPLVESYGGVEKVLCNMANELHRRNYKVNVLCNDKKEGLPAFKLNKGINFFNLCSISLPFYRKDFAIKLLSIDLKSHTRKRKRRALSLSRELYKLSKENLLLESDLIITNEPKSTLLLKKFYDAGLMKRKPIIQILHGVPSCFEPFLSQNTEIFSFVEKTVVLRPEYAKHLEEKYLAKNILSIANVVNQTKIKIDYAKKKLINVARVSEEKRIDLLVEAFSAVSHLHPDWELHIWGNTVNKTYSQLIIQKIEQLNHKDRIFINGVTNHVSDELVKASIFAFPSDHEGFPLAMTEAMAIGLPVVGCKDCSGVNTLIRNGANGILTEPTPEAFAQGLLTLIENVELREKLGQQAKEDMKQFAPEKIWDQWDELIQKCLASSNK